MKEKIISKELAKLYEKQGYLEDSLECYLSLYEETQEEEFALAIKKIRKKLDPAAKELTSKSANLSEKKPLEKKPEVHWEKPLDHKPDPEDQDDKNRKLSALFEQWVNMIVLEKKIQSFKKIQIKHE